MSLPPEEQIKILKAFLENCKLEQNDSEFFRNYILLLESKVPKTNDNFENKIEEKEMFEDTGVESEESEVELDYEGVIEPDNDPPQAMGYTNQEISEEDIEISEEKKRIAMELFSKQKYDEAINIFTEAILLFPNSALLYTKRGQCYLQLMKPNACIRDCTRAIEINPDCAIAYKFRGRAHRFLGNFLKSAEDLRNACKIDYDVQADDWLREVSTNARKLEEHQRKYERKRLEKELKETRERISRMREEQQKRAAEVKDHTYDLDYESIGSGPISADQVGNFAQFLKLLMENPEFVEATKVPEVIDAFKKIPPNFLNFLKCPNQPEFMHFFNKMSSLYAEQENSNLKPSEGPKRSLPDSDLDLD